MAQWSLANLAAWAVQAAVLVAAGAWLPSRLRLGSPRLRVALFRVLLVACIALPLAQPWRPSPASPAPVELSAVSATGLSAVGVSARPDPARTAAPTGDDSAITRVHGWLASLPWAVPILAVLAAGAVLRLAWLGLGLASLARLRRRSVVVDPDLPSIREAARAVGVGAEFREAPRVARPVTFGLRRPVVLVPPGFGNLDPTHQLAVACHELLHVKRQDWLRVVGDEILRALLWFHPAVWWLIEQIHLGTEQMIDRQVVEMLGDRRAYLRALLALAGADPGTRLQPAACFLDHGHLRQRVAMLMKEASMSRNRLVTSFAAVAVTVAAGAWWSVGAFPLHGVPPQAQRPGVSTATPAAPPDETALKKLIQANPKDTANYYLLARQYEKAGELGKVAKTLEAAVNAAPADRVAYMQVVGFYHRHGNFDKTAEWLGRWAAATPQDPIAHYTAASYYWEKAYRDASLTEAQKRSHVERGIQEADAAIALNTDYMEALVYKSLLLRLQASVENDPATAKTLIAEADRLRDQATEIRDARKAAGAPTETYPSPKVVRGSGSALAPPPPPLPPPPPPPPPPDVKRGVAGGIVGGMAGDKTAAVRVGGDIKPPMKIKDVKPVYPEEAKQAKVQGTVIVEAMVDETGRVVDAKVLRSVAMLDQAALDAVRQWEFAPTRIDGKLVPVVMTVTVAFRLD